MSLDAALAIASSGLASISNQYDVISQNVANANTTGWSAEVATQSSSTADGMGMGVRIGATGREVSTALQASVYAENATVAGLTARQTALQQIDAVQGAVNSGNDLSSLLGKLEDAFSSLVTTPTDQAAQQQVLQAAGTLAGQINTISNAIGTARQNAQDSIAGDVTSANAALATIGGLSKQIVSLKAQGKSTADLENARDAQVATLSKLLNVKVLAQPNGDVLITTAGGLDLRTDAAQGPLAVGAASLGAASSGPAVTLQGTDITSQDLGGDLGENVTLRDTTLPTFQAEIDEFAKTLTVAFSANGNLPLFAGASAADTPTSFAAAPASYVGYAGAIRVNLSSLSAYATDSSTVNAILNNVFNTSSLSVATSGLGAGGNLVAGFTSPTSLATLATAVVSDESRASSATTAQLGAETAVQTALQTQMSNASGVNVDQEMSQMVALENAYTANAKIISAIQSMWQDLLGMTT